MRTWSDEDLTQAVAANISMAGVIRQLGLSKSPGNYRFIRQHIRRMQLDDSHFKGIAHGTSIPPGTRTLDEILVLGSNVTSTKLRKKILKAGLFEEVCTECGLGPEWNGKKLTLQLDHINGDSNDNRLENLRLLCPNCHTQTPTFTGKNKSSRYRAVPRKCECCQKVVFRTSPKCRSCSGKDHAKIVWPAEDILRVMLWETPATELAKQLGVSSSAIKKHCKRLGINTPPRGHWAKVYVGKISRVNPSNEGHNS